MAPVVSSCAAGGGADERGGRPSVVVTTNVLGDVVAEVAGDEADVEVVMPLGADPHDFAASARQAEAMERADLLVVNGAGFEEGLLGVIESAEDAGAPVFVVTDHVELLQQAGDAEASESSGDPHVWTDPSRVATAVEALADRMAEIEGLDSAAIESRVGAYVGELERLDAEIDDRLGDVPPERRVLVTNHDVFGYFADRYDFEVIGTVIPSSATNASASAADIEALADLIRQRRVPAIFGETTQPTQVADALADEIGDDVEVVELYTESLGEDGSGAETYIEMMRVNAERIAEALA